MKFLKDQKSQILVQVFQFKLIVQFHCFILNEGYSDVYDNFILMTLW